MATISAERPQFFEGQYLGAEDLASIVEYLRTSNARQNLGQHSWGIAIGLQLVSQPVTDTAVEYYVQPGVAIDGYGRIIVVTSPTRIEADAFVSIGSGNVDVWIRYDQNELSATRPGFNVCSASDDYARISESFRIVVGNKSSILDRQSGVTVNDSLLVDAREALLSVDPAAQLLCDASVPQQQFPIDDEDRIWLIPLGHVKWSAASNSFLPLVDPAEEQALNNGAGGKTPDQVYESLMSSRAKRRLIGCVAESIFAADGLIRLRERTRPADPASGNDAVCNERKVQNSDLLVCDGLLKPKELVWLEGNTRIRGDARLLNGRLEFRDSDGRDYIERTVDGNLVSAITPVLMQRSDGNSKGGADLQLLLGKSDEGINRFTVGNIEFTGSDLCNLSIADENKVVIQDNGRLGIGTSNPDSVLNSPYTVRGLKQTLIENEGTEDETTYDIYRLESYESEDGNSQWQMDLWDTEGTERKSLNLTETGLADTRLFLQTGGKLGIGTTTPGESLHIYGDDPALFIDIDGLSGLHKTQLKFGSDGDIRASVYWSKSSDKLFVQHDGVDRMVVDHEHIGLGTTEPNAQLTVQANGGGARFYSGQGSGHFWLGFYTDGAPGSARAGWLGYGTNGTSDFTINNEKANGDINFMPSRNVGIGTSSPTEKLDVRGDIKLGDSGNLFAMSGVENLRTIVGRVSASANEDQGAGYSAVRLSTGVYRITFTTAFSASPVVVANSYGNDDNILSIHGTTSSRFDIHVTDLRSTSTGPENRAFTFIAIGER